MITELGEVFGGVSGGKRGILSTNGFLSLPLRLIICAHLCYLLIKWQSRETPSCLNFCQLA